MALGRLLVGHGGERGEGALITQARLYELGSRIGFLTRGRRYRELVRRSGAQPGDRVLDVGCGTGYLAGIAARAVTPGGSVLGVDASESMVEYARGAVGAPSCRFAAGTAQALPCEDAEFDVVLSSLMLHHVPDADQPATLREMLRALRPGGRLLLADFRPPTSPVMRRLVGALTGPRMLDAPDRRLVGLVRATGFTVDDEGTLGILHYVSATAPATGRAPGR
ncbi:methyltransferase domain-containing protein [Streptomyces sp. MN03-5084-2B]|nr:methyltransferase domain-containing protein [Streptomyces sp. MN03-5084-2B]